MKKNWKKVTKNGGYAARCTSNDSTIYFTKYEQPGIWKYSFNSGSEEKIIGDFSELLPQNWYVTDEGIYYKPDDIRQEFSFIVLMMNNLRQPMNRE